MATVPFVLAGVGIFCSVLRNFTVKAKEGASFSQLLKGLHKGVWIASALIAIASLGVLYVLLTDMVLPVVFQWWALGPSLILF